MLDFFCLPFRHFPTADLINSTCSTNLCFVRRNRGSVCIFKVVKDKRLNVKEEGDYPDKILLNIEGPVA